MVIVAAVDDNDRARDVIEQAQVLAEAFDDPVHVVHAISNAEFIELERTTYDETGYVGSMDEVKDYAASRAEEVSGGLDVEHEFVGLVGSAAKEVVRYGEEVDARYIVVAPRRRTPTGKVLFGSVAQAILLHASCPVVSTIRSSD